MQDEAPTTSPVHLAVFGTPRSGNTWFRALLKAALGADDFAEHDPMDIPWGRLPERAVVNLHATPSAELLGHLATAHTIVIARHPLDTLISILHFAPHHKDSNRWLLSRGGTEDSIRGVSPSSPEFRAYATGSRAKALFSVSHQWWERPGTLRVLYEDLVANTEKELERLFSAIGVAPVRPLADVVAEHAIDNLRVRGKSDQHHMWKGQPGLWKRLIPAPLAEAIAGAIPEAFATYGYTADADPGLTEAQAEANWIATLAETNRRDTEQLWSLIHAMRAAAEESRERLDRLSSELQDAQQQLAQAPIPSQAVTTFDTPLPGTGFFDPEPFAHGHACWMSDQASLEFTLQGAGDLVLTLEVCGRVTPEQLAGLEARINGRPVPLVHVQDGSQERLVGRCPSQSRTTRYQVELQVPQVLRPCDIHPADPDTRPLGVAFSKVGLKFLSA